MQDHLPGMYSKKAINSFCTNLSIVKYLNVAIDFYMYFNCSYRCRYRYNYPQISMCLTLLAFGTSC